MILPMKKVYLAVQDSRRKDAMVRLRKLGMVHIVRTNPKSDELAKILERRYSTEHAMAVIDAYKPPKKKAPPPHAQQIDQRERRMDTGPRRGRRTSDKMGIEDLEPYSLDAVNAPARPNLVKLMLDFGGERRALEEEETTLCRERVRIASWGKVEPRDLGELASAGYPVYLYEFSHDILAALPPETRYIKISENKETVRLLVLDREIPGMPSFRFSEKSLSQIDSELAGLRTRMKALEEKIHGFADRRHVLEHEMEIIDRDVYFESSLAELEKAEGVPAPYGFSCLRGYIPAEDLAGLKTAAAQNGWAVAAYDPEPEDDVPTKLRTPRLVKLLTPLTDFLDLVPGYREVDVSLWFLLFLTIYFGMIFNDAAYGLLLVITAVIGILKTRKTGVPVGLGTLLLFGISNVIWGVLTCTWFGVDVAVLPQFFKDISLSWFSTAKGTSQVMVNQNMQLFCFSLALLQLSIARIGGFIRGLRRRNLKLFADLGSLAMLWGMYNVVLTLVASNAERRFPLLPVSLYLLAGGFVLNFIFGYYEGSIPGSILNSLKNFISVILGITGVFSDIMSYIRLWAVGMAGASLAATINSLAGPTLGSFLVFFGIILLAFGHGLNMVLSTLSVLVHGVRLNILEFSGHVGLSWSGIAYKPFAETVKK